MLLDFTGFLLQKATSQMQDSSLCVVAFYLLPRQELTDSTGKTHASDLMSCVNPSSDHILSFLNLNKISAVKFSQFCFFPL